MTQMETQDAPRVADTMGSKSDWATTQRAVAEGIAAELERTVAAVPGERQWT